MQPYLTSVPIVTSSSPPAGLGQWHWAAGVRHTPQGSLWCSAAPCVQLYGGSRAPGSPLRAGSYTAPLSADSCVPAALTAPWRIHRAGESSKAVKLQQCLLSVPEHPDRLFFFNDDSITVSTVRRLRVLDTTEGLGTLQSSGSSPCRSTRHWTKLNSQFLTGEFCLCGASTATCCFAVTNRGAIYKGLFTFSQFTQLQ